MNITIPFAPSTGITPVSTVMTLRELYDIPVGASDVGVKLVDVKDTAVRYIACKIGRGFTCWTVYSGVAAISTDYYTKAETDSLLSAKVDVTTFQVDQRRQDDAIEALATLVHQGPDLDALVTKIELSTAVESLEAAISDGPDMGSVATKAELSSAISSSEAVAQIQSVAIRTIKSQVDECCAGGGSGGAGSNAAGGKYLNLNDVPEDLPGGLLYSYAEIVAPYEGFTPFMAGGDYPVYRTLKISQCNDTIHNWPWNDMQCQGLYQGAEWDTSVTTFGQGWVDDSVHPAVLHDDVGVSFGNPGCYKPDPYVLKGQSLGLPAATFWGYNISSTTPTTQQYTPWTSPCSGYQCGTMVTAACTTAGTGWTMMLSDGVTEDYAVDRWNRISPPVWSAWSSEAAVSSRGPNRYLNGYVNAMRIITKFKGSWSGGLPGWTYTITVHTAEAPFNTAPWDLPKWLPSTTHRWEAIPADANGNVILPETLIPMPATPLTLSRAVWWTITAN